MAHPCNAIPFNGNRNNEDALYVKIQDGFSILPLIFFKKLGTYVCLLRISLERYKRLITLVVSKEKWIRYQGE